MTAFATEDSQIKKNANIKVICNDQTFMETLNPLEIEMAFRAHKDDEERQKQNNANSLSYLYREGQSSTSPKVSN